MSTSQLAAQLYTLRDFTKTPSDIAQTMKKVKQLGYDAVQCSALGPIDPHELKEIVDGEGLTICATHTSYERMRDEPQAVIDEHQLWGCKHAAIGDSAVWIRKLKGRAQIVHLKDMAMRGSTQLFAEVGEGNLNWPAILDACKEAGVEWYIIEQDTCQRDPFESLGISLRNLKAMGIQ